MGIFSIFTRGASDEAKPARGQLKLTPVGPVAKAATLATSGDTRITVEKYDTVLSIRPLGKQSGSGCCVVIERAGTSWAGTLVPTIVAVTLPLSATQARQKFRAAGYMCEPADAADTPARAEVVPFGNRLRTALRF